MRRRTVSLSEEAVDALERLARQHSTNVSCVVEAAAAVIVDGGDAAQALEHRIERDRRGGRRAGSGRKKTV
jgi:predicted transcriptional regulator